jgi:hypothetical protein
MSSVILTATDAPTSCASTIDNSPSISPKIGILVLMILLQAIPRAVSRGVLNPKWFRTDIVRNAAQTRSWEIRSGDILIPADFNGDGLTDLYIANLTNWSKRYLVLMKSFGDHFEPVSRYDNDLPGWQMTVGGRVLRGAKWMRTAMTTSWSSMARTGRSRTSA